VVVEGCGANGCEYMTGGTAVVLGPTGDNFAAGMSGGMAFVYDRDGGFEGRVNPETVVVQRLASAHWEDVVHGLIAEHASETGSQWAAGLLAEWDRTRLAIWQVCPREMLSRLTHPLDDSPSSIAAE
jgi:glutamate synthase (NADPH/NADH) large chain